MPQRIRRTLALTNAVVTVACVSDSSSDPAPYQQGSLIEADRVFAAETSAGGAEGWALHFAADGVMFPRAGRIDGRSAILEAMRPAFAEGAPRLTWEPETETVAASADLGYTMGRWRSTVTTATGLDSVVATGNYVTVWRKDEAGEWRVAVDIGNDDRPSVP